ncbi:MAG: hypothetical protein ACE5FZ_09990 [Nitrospiria bacterium]
MKLHTFIKISALVLVLGLPWGALAGDLVIIVNAGNPVSELSPLEIKNYLLKKSLSWPNGKKVKSVDRKGSPPERKVYLKDVVNMSNDQLDKYWVSARYKKGVPLPPKLSGDQQIIEYVQSFGGAISYVNSSSISEAQKASIKIVGTFPMK